jgi:hypothetical protein
MPVINIIKYIPLSNCELHEEDNPARVGFNAGKPVRRIPTWHDRLRFSTQPYETANSLLAAA